MSTSNANAFIYCPLILRQKFLLQSAACRTMIPTPPYCRYRNQTRTPTPRTRIRTTAIIPKKLKLPSAQRDKPNWKGKKLCWESFENRIYWVLCFREDWEWHKKYRGNWKKPKSNRESWRVEGLAWKRLWGEKEVWNCFLFFKTEKQYLEMFFESILEHF